MSKTKYVVALVIIVLFMTVFAVAGFLLPSKARKTNITDISEFSGTIADFAYDDDNLYIATFEQPWQLTFDRKYITQEELGLINLGAQITYTIPNVWTNADIEYSFYPCTTLNCNGQDIISIEEVEADFDRSNRASTTVIIVLEVIGAGASAYLIILLANKGKKSKVRLGNNLAGQNADVFNSPTNPALQSGVEGAVYYEDCKSSARTLLIWTIVIFVLECITIVSLAINQAGIYTYILPAVGLPILIYLLFVCVRLHKFSIIITESELIVNTIGKEIKVALTDVINGGAKPKPFSGKYFYILIKATTNCFRFSSQNPQRIKEILKPIIDKNRENLSSNTKLEN